MAFTACPAEVLIWAKPPEDAIVRETKEEAGLDISNPRLVGSLSTFFTPSHKKSLEQPMHVQSLLLYCLCDVDDGEVSQMASKMTSGSMD